MIRDLLKEHQQEEFINLLKKGDKIQAIKYIRAHTMISGLVAAKNLVETYMRDHGYVEPVPKDLVAEFLQDMDTNPSDAWTYIAKQMINKGWKK